MAALLRTVTAMAADSPRGKGIALRLTIEAADAKAKAPAYVVLGYDSRLAQVITNLIDNACSFSPAGGEVRIALSRARGESAPDGEPSGDHIVVTIDDDGPGIPPHALESIFERFYTDRPGQGFGQNSGLGLSISRQIVQAHAGQIWASNRPASAETTATTTDEGEAGVVRHGAGARFVICLPAIEP
jgi:two-component system sensor histidine kinase ChvG